MDDGDHDSIVRRNLMEIAGYSPYCGGDYEVCRLPRLRWDGEQFFCRCGYRTNFPEDFLAKWRAKWNLRPNGIQKSVGGKEA